MSSEFFHWTQALPIFRNRINGVLGYVFTGHKPYPFSGTVLMVFWVDITGMSVIIGSEVNVFGEDIGSEGNLGNIFGEDIGSVTYLEKILD